MRVWIDQEMCTGDGLCEEICGQIFRLGDDGVAYVLDRGKLMNTPGDTSQQVVVPRELEQDVAEAERECPGECIHIEAA